MPIRNRAAGAWAPLHHGAVSSMIPHAIEYRSAHHHSPSHERLTPENPPLISLKKYLDIRPRNLAGFGAGPDQPFDAAMACCRAVILAIGKGAVQISPGLGEDLERNLHGLERRLSLERSPQAILHAKDQVELQLQEWSARTAGHYKAKADEVKELLIALARTAESVGSRDQGYASQFKALTCNLEKIADLDDLTQIRSSIVQNVAQLQKSVEQMTRDSHDLVSQLRAQVDTYEARLKSAEHLALKDELTGLANRRCIEERIHWSISHQLQFCIAMLDLNRFKDVNDAYGHPVGDDLLRQFASELKFNARSCDQVGRWGGDEFLVVLACDDQGARAHISRIRDWVFGKYTLQAPDDEPVLVDVDAAIGIAYWHPGQTADQLIAEADANMYADKKQAR
jgi:diguanylate cyclase (GGDEF)-like protein